MASFHRGELCRRSRILSVEEKWKILFNQQTRSSVYSAQQYSEHLRKYLESMSGEPAPTSGNKSDRPMSYLLRKLKVDLQMSFVSFVKEFIGKPQEGMRLLLSLLKVIQKTTADLARAPAKVKAQNTKRLLTDEYDCLLCIKFVLREQEATGILLDESYGLEVVASALMSSFIKSRLVALEIMSLALVDPKGLSRNLDCFTYFRLKNCEPAKFRFLISMLMSTSTHNVTFQVCCMKFFNTLLSATQDMNSRVFLQNELTTAGLDINALQQMVNGEKSLEYVELQRELTEFYENLVDIDALMNYRSSLETTNTDLQKQLSVLQDEVESMRYNSGLGSGDASMTSQTVDEGPWSAAVTNVPDPPPPPPCNGTQRQAPRGVDFPFLNWKPLHNVRNTIFQTFDYDSILDDDEITEFQEAFKLKILKPPVTLGNRPVSRTRQEHKRTFLECSRARNILIAKRKIGLTAERVKEALDEYNCGLIDADGAELLQRFVPTETEVQDVTSLARHYEDLAEAEQLMVELVSVSDLEGKLACIAFMCQFQDKVNIIEPELYNIQKSASSLLNCGRISKVFEMILFLVNYINTRKRGCSPGFHLSSLSSLQVMKSSDKKQSLVDFLVKTIARHYPEVVDWYQDIDLRPVAKGSISRLTSVVQDLEEGMKAVGDHIQQTGAHQPERLTTFYKEGEEKTWMLRRSHQGTVVAYKNVCSMFGENYEDVDPSELFGHFAQFIEAYKVSREKLVAQIKSPVPDVHDPSQYVQPAVEVKGERSEGDHPTKVTMTTGSVDCINTDVEVEFPAYINDDDCDRSNDVSYYDFVDGGVNTIQEAEQNGLMCDCCFKKTGECALANNPYAYFPTKPNSLVENWIICNNEALMAGVTADDTYEEVPPDYNDDVNNNVDDAELKVDTESYDSAFCGSDANVLKSSEGSSKETIPNTQNCPRTSTPFNCRSVTPQAKSRHEPLPDYSVCNSPTGSVRSKGTYCSELSRILNEFEGNLNQYDSEACPIASYRRFYTVKSIIYL